MMALFVLYNNYLIFFRSHEKSRGTEAPNTWCCISLNYLPNLSSNFLNLANISRLLPSPIVNIVKAVKTAQTHCQPVCHYQESTAGTGVSQA